MQILDKIIKACPIIYVMEQALNHHLRAVLSLNMRLRDVDLFLIGIGFAFGKGMSQGYETENA